MRFALILLVLSISFVYACSDITKTGCSKDSDCAYLNSTENCTIQGVHPFCMGEKCVCRCGYRNKGGMFVQTKCD
jgi:hypothetical protein